MGHEEIDAAKVFQEAFMSALSEQRQLAVETNATISDGMIEQLVTGFESAAQRDRDAEFWDVRDLQRLLGYSDYRNFMNTVEKAKDSCRTLKVPVEDHFVDATDMVDIGSGASRSVETMKLTRYACYLIAQNGDVRKKTIAFAQSYFAVQKISAFRSLAKDYPFDASTRQLTSLVD